MLRLLFTVVVYFVLGRFVYLVCFGGCVFVALFGLLWLVFVWCLFDEMLCFRCFNFPTVQFICCLYCLLCF